MSCTSDASRRALSRGAALAGTAVALAMAGCGGGTSSVVARVGATTITRAELDHWVKVLAAGDPPPGGSARERALGRRALGFLISAAWLVGEARERGVDPAAGEVERAVAAQQRASFPGGAAELSSFLASTGQTAADLRLEAQARLAAARVRRAALAGVAPVTSGAVAAYYRRNPTQFVVPERRTVWITNRKTVAAAMRIRREVAAGRSFSSMSHSETFVDPSNVLPGEPSRPLKLAIARARVGVLVGPTKARVDDFVFELRSVVPQRRRSLSEASAQIAKQLTDERRRQALADAVTSWDARWRTRTDCARGYVVDLCSQYRGARPKPSAFALR